MPLVNAYHRVTGEGISIDSDLLETDSTWSDYQLEKPQSKLDEEHARLAKDFRAMRDAELKRTDRLCLPDFNPTPELFAYRQALRDATDYPGWPVLTPDITLWPGGVPTLAEED